MLELYFSSHSLCINKMKLFSENLFNASTPSSYITSSQPSTDRSCNHKFYKLYVHTILTEILASNSITAVNNLKHIHNLNKPWISNMAKDIRYTDHSQINTSTYFLVHIISMSVSILQANFIICVDRELEI